MAVFRWIEGTSPDDVSAVVSGLAGLPALIPSIRSYRFGPDAGLGVSANADFAVVADFDDVEGYSAYASHPAHQDVLAVAGAAAGGRAAVGAVQPGGGGRGTGADLRNPMMSSLR